jgi:DNA mismatch repair protein MSH4
MDQTLLHEVTEALGKLPTDLKKCLRSVCLNMQRTKKNTSKRIASMVQGFIELKQHCLSLCPLSEALSNATSGLLRMYNDRIGENSSLELMELLDSILEDGLNENCSKTAFMNRTQQCYALKRGVFPLLDTYRREFSACAQQVHDLAKSLRNQHDSMSGLAVNYTEQRGFYFTLSKRLKGTNGRPVDLAGTEDPGASLLPKEMITLQSDARQLQCTTDELNALNSRILEYSNLCLELTESILHDQCISIVEQHLSKVKKQIDSIAELDMIVAFAHMAVSQEESYVKPVLTASGPLVIQDGRHATMEHCVAKYVSNDVVMSPENTLQLILGPNMAGKTTYLKMTGLLIIMAQMGSFVPASFMSLSPFDRLMVIMPAGPAHQGSSLINEMRQVAHVVENVGPRSLVLLDELARSTGSGEGLALAWSIAEYLALQGCKTLFSTHMTQLSKLSQMYPMCSVCHFVWKASAKGDDDKSGQPRKLKPGAPEFTHYGIDLAEAMGLPERVVSRAKESLQGE